MSFLKMCCEEILASNVTRFMWSSWFWSRSTLSVSKKNQRQTYSKGINVLICQLIVNFLVSVYGNAAIQPAQMKAQIRLQLTFKLSTRHLVTASWRFPLKTLSAGRWDGWWSIHYILLFHRTHLLGGSILPVTIRLRITLRGLYRWHYHTNHHIHVA